MKEPSVILYKTDQLLPSTLSMQWENAGWVEYLNQTGNVYYYPQMTEKHYRQSYSGHLLAIQKTTLTNQRENLGLVQHLAYELLERPFLLPLFGIVDKKDNLLITCGNSRFSANISSGTPLENIPLVVYATHVITNSNAIKITTTEEFEKIFQLEGLNHMIQLVNEDGQPKVTGSVLSHSIYDSSDGDATAPHKSLKFKCIEFWNQFVKNDKIEIRINCTPETRELINESPIFNVTFIDQPKETWGWSYGRLLGEFKTTSVEYKPQILNLWLFDITEQVDLELLLIWPTSDCSTYHTKNKKAILFHTKYSSGFKIIGDCIR